MLDGCCSTRTHRPARLGREASLNLGLPWDHDGDTHDRQVVRDGYQLLRDAFRADLPVDDHQAGVRPALPRGYIAEGPFPRPRLPILSGTSSPRVVATATRRSRAAPKLAHTGLCHAWGRSRRRRGQPEGRARHLSLPPASPRHRRPPRLRGCTGVRGGKLRPAG